MKISFRPFPVASDSRWLCGPCYRCTSYRMLLVRGAKPRSNMWSDSEIVIHIKWSVASRKCCSFRCSMLIRCWIIPYIMRMKCTAAASKFFATNCTLCERDICLNGNKSGHDFSLATHRTMSIHRILTAKLLPPILSDFNKSWCGHCEPHECGWIQRNKWILHN